jgi:hypothetical protein
MISKEIEKSILKFIWKHKRAVKASLSKKNNAGSITIPDFKLYNIAKNKHGTGIKTDTSPMAHKTKDPKISPSRCCHLILDKGVKNLHWKKDSLFNKWCWENLIFTYRRLTLNPYLSPCTKINSKWIKDLHLRPKTLKLLE